MLKLLTSLSSHRLTPLYSSAGLRSIATRPTTNPTTSSHCFHITRTTFSSTHMQVQPKTTVIMNSESFTFGPYKVHNKEVFYFTDLSYAMVNLRPLIPGHVLVCPRREVKRFVDLTADETSDLWLTAQKVGGRLESHHKASSLTLTIQDGPHAGQSVPHVHIHILPRKSGDFERNDEIYDAIDVKENELKQKLDLDKDRKDRSVEEMAKEAEEYRKLFV